jgi:exonuclease V gamma subunit
VSLRYNRSNVIHAESHIGIASTCKPIYPIQLLQRILLSLYFLNSTNISLSLFLLESLLSVQSLRTTAHVRFWLLQILRDSLQDPSCSQSSITGSAHISLLNPSCSKPFLQVCRKETDSPSLSHSRSFSSSASLSVVGDGFEGECRDSLLTSIKLRIIMTSSHVY